MKLVKKADLTFVAGRLVNKDDTVVTPYDLVGQVNEVAEIIAFTEFLNENEETILVSEKAEPLTFTMLKPKPAEFKSGLIVSTPMIDEAKRLEEARAHEFLDLQVLDTIDRHLARYGAIARFIADDVVTVDGDISSAKMFINPLELTSDIVIKAVEAYHEPRIVKLASLVKVTR